MLADIILSTDFFYSVIRLTTPILFASLSAVVARQSGITNMAIEGIMLFSALFAVIGSALSQSAFVGLLSAIAIGGIIGLMLAYFKIRMKADELLVAIAINLLATGATVFILYLFSGEKATSAAMNSKVLPIIKIPGLMDIPILGNVLLGQNILVYLSFISVFILNVILYKTPLGLRIRAVGGNPDSASSVGVSVEKTQYTALLISGILAGIGGAFMSMGYMTVFTRGMTAGRGFIGLAASNIGGQNPIGALFASLLFGFFDALGNNLQTLKIPVEFVYMIPYVTTIIAFAYSSYLAKNRKKSKKKAKKAN